MPRITVQYDDGSQQEHQLDQFILVGRAELPEDKARYLTLAHGESWAIAELALYGGRSVMKRLFKDE